MINMCISPVNPFGAGSSGLCFLHQLAGISMQIISNIASINKTTTDFVIEMSNGRTSLLLMFSHILYA